MSNETAAAAQGATTFETIRAVALWAVVALALGFGIVATLVKAAGLFQS